LLIIRCRISSLSQLSTAVSDLELMLIQSKSTPKGAAGKKAAYDRSAYDKYAADPAAAFQTLYSFCFTLAKPECATSDYVLILALTVCLQTIPQY
jgi:DCN1-like protein 4/5